MKSTFPRVALAAALVGAVSMVALLTQQRQMSIAHTQLMEKLAGISGLTVGSATIDPWRGRVVINDAHLVRAGLAIHVGHVALPIASPLSFIVPRAEAAEGTASANDITFDFSGTHYGAKHVEATGTTMTNADLASLFDENSKVPAAERIKKLNAATISIPELTATTQTLGNNSISYHNILLQNVVDGKIMKATSSGADASVSVAAKGAIPAQQVIEKAGAIALTNFDISPIIAFYTQVRTDPNTPFQQVLELGTVDGVSVNSGSFKGEIRKIVQQNVKMRPPAHNFSQTMQSLTASGQDPKAPPPKLADMLRLEGDVFSSISFEKFEVDDFAIGINIPAKGVEAAKPLNFSFGAIISSETQTPSGIPADYSLSFEHYKVDLASLPQNPGLKSFMDMGYSMLDLSNSFAFAFNEAAQQLAIKSLSISGVGMGSASISATFGNVSKDLFTTNQTVALASAMAMLVKSVDIHVVNDGLVEKLISYQAKKSGKSTDEITQGLIAASAAAIPSMLGTSQGGRDIGNALAKFFAAPKNIDISATSADGLGAGDTALLSRPVELMKKIDIKTSVNQ